MSKFLPNFHCTYSKKTAKGFYKKMKDKKQKNQQKLEIKTKNLFHRAYFYKHIKRKCLV